LKIYKKTISKLFKTKEQIETYPLIDLEQREDVLQDEDPRFQPSKLNEADSSGQLPYWKRLQKEAEDILESAKRKAIEIEKRAYEEAFEQGQKAGKELAEKRFLNAINSFVEALKELNKTKEQILYEQERLMVEIVCKIAYIILEKEISINPEVILNIIRKAIDTTNNCCFLKIRVNPVDLEFCQKYKEEILQKIEDIKEIKFEADRTVKRGGAIVETDFGEIDARIETQLEEIKKALLSQEIKEDEQI